MRPFTRHKQTARYAVKVLLGVGLLIFLVSRLDISEMWISFTTGNGILIACAFLLLFPNLGVQFLKWRYLSRFLRDDLTDNEIAGSLFAGFSIGIVTPARVGEPAGRAFALRAVSRSKAFTLTVIDKMSSMIVTATAGICGLFLVLLWTGHPPSPGLAAVLTCLVLLVGAALYSLARPNRLRSLWRFVPKGTPRTRFTKIMDGMQTLHPGQIAFLLLLSTAFYLIFLGQYILLLEAFGSIRVDYAAGAVAAALLAKSILPPLTVGELGIREGSVMFFLTLLGGTGTAALNASLLIFVVNIFVPALVGLFYLPRLALSPVDSGS